MKEILNWGIIGNGFIANRMASNLQKNDIKIEGVLGRNLSKLSVFAEKYGIKHVYTDLSQFLRNSKINAVYIAVPNNLHYHFALMALRAGKHVLCEKPMVINQTQFLKLKNFAHQENLILEEAFTPFHMPETKLIQKYIADGKIGDIKQIEAHFNYAMGHLDPQSRFLNIKLGGGNFLDEGVYPLCFALQYLKNASFNIKSLVQWSNTGVDLASTILMSNSTQEAILSSSYVDTFPRDGIISGTKGYIYVNHFSRSESARIVLNNGSIKKVSAGKSNDAWIYEAKDMQDYVNCGHDRGELALSERIIKIMDQVRKQWNLKYPFEKEQ